MTITPLPNAATPRWPELMPIIHLVFSNLKTWLNGIHHGVSAKHLQAYLNEFTSEFNRRFYPFNAFDPCSASLVMQPHRHMPGYTRESGNTLDVVGVCVNRKSNGSFE